MEILWSKQGKIWKGAKQKLFGIKVGRNLYFDDQVSSLCRKVGGRFAVLARLSKFMRLKRKRIFTKTFMQPQIGCYPLIWIAEN